MIFSLWPFKFFFLFFFFFLKIHGRQLTNHP